MAERGRRLRSCGNRFLFLNRLQTDGEGVCTIAGERGDIGVGIAVGDAQRGGAGGQISDHTLSVVVGHRDLGARGPRPRRINPGASGRLAVPIENVHADGFAGQQHNATEIDGHGGIVRTRNGSGVDSAEALFDHDDRQFHAGLGGGANPVVVQGEPAVGLGEAGRDDRV